MCTSREYSICHSASQTNSNSGSSTGVGENRGGDKVKGVIKRTQEVGQYDADKHDADEHGDGECQVKGVISEERISGDGLG